MHEHLVWDKGDISNLRKKGVRIMNNYLEKSKINEQCVPNSTLEDLSV